MPAGGWGKPGDATYKAPSGMPASGIPAKGVGHGPAQGLGYGGDAGGVRQVFAADNQPGYEAQARGKAQMATLRELLEPYRGKVVQTWVDVLESETASDRDKITAAEKIADRLEGKPAQTLQGPPDDAGKPTNIAVAFVRPGAPD